MAGDQQDDALAGADRALEADIDGAPGAVERHSVKVDHTIRLNVSRAQPPIPAGVEGSGG